jgi:hypothetical protein
MYRSSWLSNVEEGNARMFDSSGRFADAENAFHRAVEQMKGRDGARQADCFRRSVV